MSKITEKPANSFDLGKTFKVKRKGYITSTFGKNTVSAWLKYPNDDILIGFFEGVGYGERAIINEDIDTSLGTKLSLIDRGKYCYYKNEKVCLITPRSDKRRNICRDTKEKISVFVVLPDGNLSYLGSFWDEEQATFVVSCLIEEHKESEEKAITLC